MKRSVGCALLLLVSCSRDLVLPPEPQPPPPGQLTGTVVLAQPGTVVKQPAAGAEVRLLGSGQSTLTTAAGAFLLKPVDATSGLLLIRKEVDGVVRQRVLQLADYQTGRGRAVDLREVVLGENARVRGKALRGDLTTRGGHSGTTIFVPAGPFTALTGDDGSFVIDNMPEGPVELYVFRTGYAPVALGNLSLRSGESLELRDVTLVPAQNTRPGSIKGTLAFDPVADGVGDTAVRLVGSTGNTLSVPVASDLSYAAPSVPVDLYRLVVTRSGYSQVDVINVLIVAEVEAVLPTLTLTTAPAFDAGPPPMVPDSGPPDAGPPDAGPPDAGPPDAGPPDAGPPDAGPVDAGVDGGVLCSVMQDCGVGFWCDVNRCVPLCAVGSQECGFGRVCEAATRTCVRSCVGQCPAGQVCNSQNVCQAVCDTTFPCPSGQVCRAGMCGPECVTSTDCNSPFLTCDLGICKRNLSCVVDQDCVREQMCIGGQCGARPTDAGVRPDGGRWTDGGLVFACASACHCKMGERCTEGFCEPDVVPTFFVARDGGGDGGGAGSPSSSWTHLFDGGAKDMLVALRAEDSFDLGATTLHLGEGQGIAGGFTACGVNRWVRRRDDRTSITGVGGTGTGQALLYVAPPNLNSAARVSLSGLSVRSTGLVRCGQGTGISLTRAPDAVIEDVDSTLALGNCNAGQRTVAIRLEASPRYTLRRLKLLGLSGAGSEQGFLEVVGGSGLLEDLETPLLGTTSSVTMVEVDAPVGAVTARRFRLNRTIQANGRPLAIANAGATPVSLTDVDVAWPSSSQANTYTTEAVLVSGSHNVTLRNVRVLPTDFTGVNASIQTGVRLSNSGGVIEDLDVAIPVSPIRNTTRQFGVTLEGPRGTWDLNRLNVTSQGGFSSNGHGVVGMYFASNLSQGPGRVRNSRISVVDNIEPRTIWVQQAVPSYGLTLTDNHLVAGGAGECSADVITLYVEDFVRLERNLVEAGGGVLNIDLFQNLAVSRVEAFGNVFRTLSSNGSSACNSSGYFGNTNVFVASTSSATGRYVGNTFDLGGVTGQAGAATGFSANVGSYTFESNIFQGGNASVRFITPTFSSQAAPALASALFGSNYFAYGMGPGAVGERLFDGGYLDGGNVYGGTVSCFAPAVAQPDGGAGFGYFLAANSPCKDRGVLGQRGDGTTVTLDYFGRPRDGGTGPDIGAVEGP